MPSSRSPLADTERLIIDGSNLLHAMRRGAHPAPPATLIGRLRGVIEPAVRIELILDGPPEGALGDTRIASGVSVRYSGRYSGDAVIAKLVAEASQPVTLLVVTDDAELTDRVRRLGGRVARTEWIIARLDRSRLESPSIGRPRPPAPPPGSQVVPGGRGGPGGPGAETDDDDRRRWQPGRGATRKRGNPKREPRSGGGD